MLKKLTLTSLLVFFVISAHYGQTLTSVILDSVTHKPVPYVTVQLNNRGLITNEEGRFTFLLQDNVKATDSLFISSIGYASLGKPLNEFTGNAIYLSPKAIELNPVIVTNKTYTPREIIELVEENIEKNYNLGLGKKRLFLRETYQNRILKSDYKIKKSTIDAFNKNFLDSVIRTLPKSNTYYTEMLGDLYGSDDEDEQKLDLIKASELYDKNKDLDQETLEKKFNQIVKQNIKSDSYFKIKSGLFGTKIDEDEMDDFFDTEVDSTDAAALQEHLEKERKKKEERREFFSEYKRKTLANLYKNLPIFDDSDYNVLYKPRRYDLVLENFTYIGDAPVYVISFTPDGGADYKGKLYINSDDFALIRLDFENVKPLRNFKLLGVSLNEYLAKGRIIFNKGDDQKYHLGYYDVVKGIRAGIKRPLKIIEKNKNVKGRRKQNELSMKIDAAFGNRNRYELVVFNETPINSGQFKAFTEDNEVLPTYMPNYDPEFWRGYDIIEPNQAIKEFTSEVQLAE
ncbi:MAG: carboxypeptidase-like regulatory domain-containing protein [Pricia sp.]|nr:carboxypeptidase-like regulatory domain-containing protein [Pricia sp.]